MHQLNHAPLKKVNWQWTYGGAVPRWICCGRPRLEKKKRGGKLERKIRSPRISGVGEYGKCAFTASRRKRGASFCREPGEIGSRPTEIGTGTSFSCHAPCASPATKAIRGNRPSCTDAPRFYPTEIYQSVRHNWHSSENRVVRPEKLFETRVKSCLRHTDKFDPNRKKSPCFASKAEITFNRALRDSFVLLRQRRR